MTQNAQKTGGTAARKAAKPRKKRLLPNAVTRAVGEQLRLSREAKGLTQEDLAAKAEVERSRVSKVENGIVNASTLSLAAFCHALGITLSELFANVKLAHPPSIEGGTLRRKNQAVLDKPAVRKTAKKTGRSA